MKLITLKPRRGESSLLRTYIRLMADALKVSEEEARRILDIKRNTKC